MKVDLCQSCGSAFDADEIKDGYCYNCQPDSGEEAPELDMSRIVGDCE